MYKTTCNLRKNSMVIFSLQCHRLCIFLIILLSVIDKQELIVSCFIVFVVSCFIVFAVSCFIVFAVSCFIVFAVSLFYCVLAVSCVRRSMTATSCWRRTFLPRVNKSGAWTTCLIAYRSKFFRKG